MSHAASASNLLEDAEREELKRIVDQMGLNAAAAKLSVSRGVLSSVIAGISVRKGSLEMVRESLVRFRKQGGVL